MSFVHLYKPLFGLSVLCPSIHPSIRPSVCPFVCHKVVFSVFDASSKVLLNVLVCSSVYLPDFSKSADARDFGLMTLFFPFRVSVLTILLASVSVRDKVHRTPS